MICQVLYPHDGEGQFDTYKAGTQLSNPIPCQEYHGWYHVTYQDIAFYVCGEFLDKDNRLLVDYNPTELQVQCGDKVSVFNIYHGWVWAKIIHKQSNKGSPLGRIGWVPVAIMQIDDGLNGVD